MAVADMGGFTKAAASLGLTQPAVSQCIADVEKIVGARLFSREKGRVALTDSGRMFYRYAENILYWYSSAEAAFSFRNDNITVNIEASEDILSGFLTDILIPLQSSAANVAFNVSSGVRYPESSLPDLKVYSSLQSDTISWESGEQIGFSPLCAVVSSSDRNACRNIRSLAEIRDSRIALWTGLLSASSGTSPVQPASAVGTRDGATVLGLDGISRAVFRSPSAESVKKAVLISAMVGILPYYTVQNELADKSLVRLPLVSPLGNVAIHLDPSPDFARTSLYRVIRQRISDMLA